MPVAQYSQPVMEVLSPRSTNVPVKSRATMKKPTTEVKKVEEKPQNPDRIDDKWRPPVIVAEPGLTPETYVTGKKLGKGGFAVCFEGRAKVGGSIFALKVVKAKVEQKKMMEKFRTELQIHAKMSHPNIVEFHQAFTFDEHTYVILELCHNGNLTDMVKARSCLSLPEVRRFMIQICGGVKYMHKRSVIHRDLKMGNIFLDGRMNIKIGDFGLAAVMADEQDRRTTLCGTPNYIAPEILSKSGTRGHDNKVDTWAIGVICYAMLMGSPPFQSKTQQEIYAKLKTLEYEWKIDSKNYIPQAAKDFVSSCLNLVSAERPEMDDLVEHDFFKIGAVADVLDVSCLKTKPVWLEVADPRGDKVSPGYGIEHAQICKESGVGKTADGRIRPAVGERSNISTLVEIEIENRQGCAPQVPLPEGILYKQLTPAHAEWTALEKNQVGPVRPRSRKPPQDPSTTLAAPQILAQNHPDKDKAFSDNKDTSSRAPPVLRPIQSFAAQQRQRDLPVRSIPRPTEISKRAISPIKVPVDENPIPTTRGYLRERPVRSISIRSTRSNSNQDQLPEVSKAPLKSSSISSGMNLDSRDYASVHSEAPRTRRAATIGRSGSKFDVSSRPASIISVSGENVTRSSSDSASLAETEAPPRVLRPISTNDRDVLLVGPEKLLSVKNQKAPGSSTSTYSGSSSASALTRSRLISPNDSYTRIKHSSSSSTVTFLRNLYNSLSKPRNTDKPLPSDLEITSQRPGPHPRVDKWVDYSTKHGIAYILSDHTVGMVLKSSDENSRPSSCVIMRNAKIHTIRRAKGLEQQLVPQDRGADNVEFVERFSPDEEMNRLSIPASDFKLDLERYKDTASAVIGLGEDQSRRQKSEETGCGAERVKALGLLDKFGKYMNKISEVDGKDDDQPTGKSKKKSHRSTGIFIDFYQRLGNVGVWRFRHDDGPSGFQYNFPDHTKVVVYRSNGEWMVDLVYLAPEDARSMANGAVLGAEAFERRGILTFTIQELLKGTGVMAVREHVDIIRSNEVKEKLAWIRSVLGCWIRAGGVGKMGSQQQRIGWSGLQEKKEGSWVKLLWVTVGRDGGDGDGDLDGGADGKKA